MTSIFKDVAERSPCTCRARTAVYFGEAGCGCPAMEKVAKAHMAGVAVEPLTDEQREVLLADTDDSEPGPWETFEEAGDERDRLICHQWSDALRSYVRSL